METVAITISLPRSLLAAADVREQELAKLTRETVAVDLYRRGRLSLGKAAEVAGLATKWEMTALLARHDVWLDYDAQDIWDDAAVVREVLGA